jgi:hypothetical protein
MKTYAAVELHLHAFLTSALDGSKWSPLRPGCFTPRERAPGTHWIVDWVGPRTGLDEAEKKKKKSLSLLGIEPRVFYRIA